MLRFQSLQDFVTGLESMGELKRIDARVSPELEITEIADRMVKGGGPALLFSNNGTTFPLLINAFASDKRIAAALGVESLDEIPARLDSVIESLAPLKESGIWRKLPTLPHALRMMRWMPKKVRGRGSCQEVILPEPDLSLLPVLKCWPHDGGPFITLPLVHTIDPITGQQNTGMYRMQVYDKRTTGMHWHVHKDGAAHYRRYNELGKIMPVTVTLGGDPVLTYAATAPLPPFINENLFAGFVRKRGVRLVKSLTNDIWIPAGADIVIEGYVDTAELLRNEGPFGDHTGFYSLQDLYPVFHVTAMSHRRNAIYPATIVGIPPQEDLWLGKATEKIFLMPLQKAISAEIRGLNMPAEGVFHNLVIASVEKSYPGQPQKVANALWGAGQMMLNKIVVIVNKNIDVENYRQVIREISGNVDPVKDIFFSKGPLDVLDHSAEEFAYGSKMCIDATNSRQLPVNCFITDGLKALPASLKGVAQVSQIHGVEYIPAIIIFVDKSPGISVSDIHNRVAKESEGSGIRFIIYLDSEASGLSVSSWLWLAAGNSDPRRDYLMGLLPDGSAVAGFDATRKTRSHDNFLREWPNLVVMNMDTINLVNNRWDEFNCGEMILSPSLPFMIYQQGEGVAANTDKD